MTDKTISERMKRWRARKRGEKVELVAPGPKPGFKQSPEHVAKRTGPSCGHSACRQNWIDTGSIGCVERSVMADLGPVSLERNDELVKLAMEFARQQVDERTIPPDGIKVAVNGVELGKLDPTIRRASTDVVTGTMSFAPVGSLQRDPRGDPMATFGELAARGIKRSWLDAAVRHGRICTDPNDPTRYRVADVDKALKNDPKQERR